MMCRARARLHGRSSERARLRQTDLTRALIIADYVYVRVYTRYNDVEVAEAIKYCTFVCVCVGVCCVWV